MIRQRPLSHYALLSIGAGVSTFGLKFGASYLTGSVSMLSDAIESLANLAAAMIAYGSLRVAARPEDKEHPFGHSKVEYIAAGIEGGLIMAAAIGIAVAAVHRLLYPAPLDITALGLGLNVAASAVNLAVAFILFRVSRERHSVALGADAHHLMTDVWTSVVVLVGVGVVSVTGWLWLDPLVGLLLAAHIAAVAARIVKEAADGVMDAGLLEDDLERIRGILTSYRSEGIEYHALRTRAAGALKFMTVHLLMPGDWTIARGHAISEQIESELTGAFPRLVVLTHVEPIEDPASFEDVALERHRTASISGAFEGIKVKPDLRP
jgi:cation diffusion facilitator family transporter